MADPIITVENLGKRYRIRHQQQPRYHTLRDSLAATAKMLLARSSAVRPSAVEEDFWALKDVSFQINRGDIVGIIGRNGAGKSTLLKILSRITEPTTGRIRLRGRVASLLEVGTGFHPELTGRENIFLNGAILGMTKAEIKKHFDEIVAFSEVENFLDTPVKHYSSGMYTRLAFSVAAHLRSEVLIVDEVLAVGDAAFRAKCITKMQNASADDRTVLFVSHDLAAIQQLTHKAILLRQGSLVAYDGTTECVSEYMRTVERPSSHRLPTPRPDTALCFTDVFLTDSNGGHVQCLTITEPFTVRVCFSCRALLDNVVIGIAVHTNHDVTVFATHTNDFGEVLRVAPGTWEAVCHVCPNLLRAGAYRISVGALSFGTLIAHEDDAARFSIEPVLKDATTHYDDRVGLLHMPMKWTMTTRAQ